MGALLFRLGCWRLQELRHCPHIRASFTPTLTNSRAPSSPRQTNQNLRCKGTEKKCCAILWRGYRGGSRRCPCLHQVSFSPVGSGGRDETSAGSTTRTRRRRDRSSIARASRNRPAVRCYDCRKREIEARRAGRKHHDRTDHERDDAADTNDAERADMGLGHHQADAEQHEGGTGIVDGKRPAG
jgi:hypothetical protein